MDKELIESIENTILKELITVYLTSHFEINIYESFTLSKTSNLFKLNM